MGRPWASQRPASASADESPATHGIPGADDGIRTRDPHLGKVMRFVRGDRSAPCALPYVRPVRRVPSSPRSLFNALNNDQICERPEAAEHKPRRRPNETYEHGPSPAVGIVACVCDNSRLELAVAAFDGSAFAWPLLAHLRRHDLCANLTQSKFDHLSAQDGKSSEAGRHRAVRSVRGVPATRDDAYS